jgi:hypothetical protein
MVNSTTNAKYKNYTQILRQAQDDKLRLSINNPSSSSNFILTGSARATPSMEPRIWAAFSNGYVAHLKKWQELIDKL